MKIVISPAKSLNFEKQIPANQYSSISFPQESQQLAVLLKKFSVEDIKSLMKISPALAELNYHRFQQWHLPFTLQNAKQAGFVFTGEVYKGLQLDTLSLKEIQQAQKSLRILSGLYGVLRPLDLIQPYRLEMGTRLQVDENTKNLYQFWQQKITDFINNELKEDDGILVNLASNEYFKAINKKELKGEVVTCNFKDKKADTYKIVMMYAKKARGEMARYIIQNKLSKQEELQTFDKNGYIFNPRMSTENEFIFTRG